MIDIKFALKEWIPHTTPRSKVPTGKAVGDYPLDISPHFKQTESLSPCLQDSITRAQRNRTYRSVAPFSFELAYK
jgi:hypothetical protein